MKKSKLFAMLTAVTLVAAIGVGSTFAYLTAKTDEVVNTFTLDKGISLDLNESKVSADDNYITDQDGDNKWTVKKNDYANLVPGQKLFKDPTVTVGAGSTACYVFVYVSYNKKQFTNITIDNAWTPLEGHDGYYYAVVEKSNDDTNLNVFNGVTVSYELEGKVGEAEKLEDITVKAAAVQYGVLADEKAAFEEVESFFN